jgi:uncharacterized protein (DUF3820 family)
MVVSMEKSFDCDNLWSDFESKLALFSREWIMHLVEASYNEINIDDYRASEIYMPIDQVISSVDRFTIDLKYRFYKWLRQTYLPKGHKGYLLTLKLDALFLNFNYTTTLETLYGIDESKIFYIHGNLKKSWDNIILGHGIHWDRSLDTWIEKHKDEFRFHSVFRNKRGRYYPNTSFSYLAWFTKSEKEFLKRTNEVSQIIIEQTVPEIEEYFKYSFKDTRQVIKENQYWFDKYQYAKDIFVLGHSLSEIDYHIFIT